LGYEGKLGRRVSLLLGTSLRSFFFLFFRGRFLDLDFDLGYEGKLGRSVFLPLGMPLTFLFLSFFRGHFLGSDFGLGYEGKLGGGWFCSFLAMGNVINVSFAFFP